MATEIALRIMPIGNHMTNAEEIMIVSYNEVVAFEYVFEPLFKSKNDTATVMPKTHKSVILIIYSMLLNLLRFYGWRR
jgi:hypothetical protein